MYMWKSLGGGNAGNACIPQLRLFSLQRNLFYSLGIGLWGGGGGEWSAQDVHSVPHDDKTPKREQFLDGSWKGSCFLLDATRRSNLDGSIVKFFMSDLCRLHGLPAIDDIVIPGFPQYMAHGAIFG